MKGSAAVAENTPRFGGHRHSATARLRLHPENQVATRLAAAAVVAAVVGSFINESRFYWALIGAFTVFNSTNTTREQIVKSVTRVVGTFVGIIIGAGLAHAIGMSVWAVPVICLVMAVGISLAKVDYFFCALGITISVSLMYEQLGTFTDMLLVTRLVETLVGVLCATAASLLIFPVRTGRAVTVGWDAFLESMDNLLDATERALAGTPEEQKAARGGIPQEIRNMENARFQVTAAANAVPGWMPVPASLRYPATTYERASQVTRLVVVDILGPGVQQDYREEVLGELRESRHRLEGYFSGPRDDDAAGPGSTVGQASPTVDGSAPEAPADGRTLATFSHLGILRTAVDDLGRPHLTPTRAA
ncbi:FUSC family protein [Corynebacterium nuruki]|uniref:FUSC family protein n=1 Tax=Corynebacterium nuruki TaxID=1032851 RepID=UPI00024876ED|nr:FUSC family protein [Corynebacterium nuruki]